VNSQFATISTATTEVAMSTAEPQCARAVRTGQELPATKPITASETRAPVTAHASARVQEDTFVIATLDSSVFCVKSALHKLQ